MESDQLQSLDQGKNLSGRDISIDFLKFIAVFCIVNSHLDSMYPRSLTAMATGGAIGDALFFFCSGFTLLMKPLPRFDQWYKRRISRIYPTVFAAFLLLTFLLSTPYTLLDFLGIKGFWFVQCILIYYIPIYWIGKYGKRHLFLILAAEGLLFTLVYYLGGFSHMHCYKPKVFLFFYFFFMLFGAAMGAMANRKVYPAGLCLLGVSVFTVLFFGSLWATFRWCFPLHLISALPLFGLVYSLYELFHSGFFARMGSGTAYQLVRWFGGLCLEVYLIHFVFLTERGKQYFPLNIILYLAAVFLTAYVVRILANFFTQTLSAKEYRWLDILKVNL